MQSIAAADLRSANKGGSDLVFLAIEEMGVVETSNGFELDGLRTNERADFSRRILMPGRFAIVGENFWLPANDEFRVIAVGRFQIEGIGAGFGVTLAGEGAFDGEGLEFAELAGAASGFD